MVRGTLAPWCADRGRRIPAGGLCPGGSRQADPGRRIPAGGLCPGGSRQADPGRRIVSRRIPAGGSRQADRGRRIVSRRIRATAHGPRPTAHGPRPRPTAHGPRQADRAPRLTAHDSRHTFQQPVGWHPGASLTWTHKQAGRQAGRQKKTRRVGTRRACRCYALALNGEQIARGTHRPRLELSTRAFAEQIATRC
jgi:hypothetical protein